MPLSMCLGRDILFRGGVLHQLLRNAIEVSSSGRCRILVRQIFPKQVPARRLVGHLTPEQGPESGRRCRHERGAMEGSGEGPGERRVRHRFRRRHVHGAGHRLVEQRVVEALKTCDQGYVLETGRVVLQGPRDALLTDDRVRKAYLGM